ncbi:MAG: CHAT domain-containing protein [Pyrinomonadaceae bacterium]
MSETLKTEDNIREYLLGRVADDARLAEYEELLFSDDQFCELVEITEDALINDHVFGRLSETDEADFVKTLENNKTRRGKVTLTSSLKEKAAEFTVVEKGSTPSLFDSLKAFFSQPMYAGGFALLVIAVLVGSLFLFRSSPDELANLKDIYKKERPVEPRIAGFEYAPLTVTRGAADDANKNKLELEKTRFLQAAVENPNAANFHKLGVFYLTQQNYKDAIENLEKAVKLDDKNAAFQNDLGTAYFELAKQSKDDKLLNLSRANEAFSAALKLNAEALEALFNRSLVMQEMGLRNQATESWNLYLQKDPSSKWSDEARKNLEKLKQMEIGATKTKEQVLDDFLLAYRNRDWQFAEKIHNSTKGMLNGVSPFEQLTRRYLDARKARDALTAKESLDAMNYIGNLEKEKHADFFYAELADHYANVDDPGVEKQLKAKDLWADGYKLIRGEAAAAVTKFEASAEQFALAGNDIEARLARLWAAQMLIYDAKLDESVRRMSLLLADARSRQFKTIEANLNYWIGIGYGRQKEKSRSIANLKAAYSLSRETGNEFETRHSADTLADAYRDLGETHKAMEYSGVAGGGNDLYYESPSQTWRNLNTTSELLGEMNSTTSSIDFAHEGVWLGTRIFADTPGVNESLQHLVNAFRTARQFDAAFTTASRSNEIAIRREQSPQNSKVTAESFLVRADVLREAGRCDEALVDYQKAFEYFRSLREVTYGLYDLHKGKLLCLRVLDRHDEFEVELETVLNISEEYRRRIREDESRQAFFDNEHVVFDAAVANLLAAGDSERAFELGETSRSRSLLEFVESEKSIAEIEEDFVAVSEPLGITEIQKRLPANVQVVAYQMLEDMLAISLVTKTGFETSVKSITAEQLNSLVGSYRQYVVGRADGDEARRLAQQLYSILLPTNLDADKILCFVPDKSLHQVPFGALISPADRYLIEDFQLVHSPSVSVFVISTENAKLREKLNENLLSIGNPRFDRAENPGLRDLPDAEIEAKEISEVYDRKTTLLDRAANKQAFLSGLETAGVVHFAGHFVANPRSPQNSKMLLAEGELRAFELADKKLPLSKLVVMSACETSFEQFNNSEGSIGIARTLLAMGTPIVVASGWKVDSEATKELMIAFHKKRRVDKLSSVAALRKAQLEMIRSADFSSPYYWSAFSATGGLTNY